MLNEPPALLVSVCCITYNHEDFLSQMIDSVLMQETDFAVELVIGEDCSTDRTRQLALDYKTRYPERIRLLLPDHNLGIMANLMATMAACTGRYVAFIEGDDYWTDPHKLQRQIDIMEAHPNCALCIHDAEVLVQDSTKASYRFSTMYRGLLPDHDVQLTQADLVRCGWGIPSASMLFRSSLLLPLPTWIRGVFSGDYTMQLLSTQHGYVYYLNEVMSCYRLHAGGVMQTSHKTLLQNQRRIFEIEHYKQFLPKQLHAELDIFLEYLYFERSEKMAVLGSKMQQLRYYLKAMTINKQRLGFHLRRLIKRITASIVK